jgi:hypothetical protein
MLWATTDDLSEWVGKRMATDEGPDETANPDANEPLDTDDVVDRYERKGRHGDSPDSVSDSDSRGGPQPPGGVESSA